MLVIDDAIIAAVAGSVAKVLTEHGLHLLRGDPEKQAFKTALKEALQEFDRDYAEWAAALFNRNFLTKEAAPVLASAVMRSSQPTADQLARAYAASLGRDESSDDLVQRATPIAAEFLIRLDMAMRRQGAFRQHFDSLAMDGTAIYVYELLQQAKADWADARAERITEALEFFIGAAGRYEDAGRIVARGHEVDPEYIAKAREAVDRADLRLHRMRYTDGRYIRQQLGALVEAPYRAIVDSLPNADPEAVTALANGFRVFRDLVGEAAPL